MKPQKSEPRDFRNPFAGEIEETFNVAIKQALGKSTSLFNRSVKVMQEEGMRFAKQRLSENVKAVEMFAGCKTLPELVDAQQRWFADMTRSYSEEWTKYGKLINETAHEDMSPDEIHRQAA